MSIINLFAASSSYVVANFIADSWLSETFCLWNEEKLIKEVDNSIKNAYK